MVTNERATLGDMMLIADEIEQQIKGAGYTEAPATRQTLALAEEVGEFVGAVRRWSGLARRSGPFSDVEAELADVVITAFVSAVTLGVDLPKAIAAKLDVLFSRGWREENRD